MHDQKDGHLDRGGWWKCVLELDPVHAPDPSLFIIAVKLQSVVSIMALQDDKSFFTWNDRQVISWNPSFNMGLLNLASYPENAECGSI